MSNNRKISIRFFDDREVRAVWDEVNAKWWFSVLDIVAVLTNQDDYSKVRNYWKYLKAKLRKEKSELVSSTTQLKLVASDGKRYLTDMLDNNGIISLGKQFPAKNANRFIEWFTNSAETIDGKSKIKAYALFESLNNGSIEVGTTKGLQQIHSYLFGGLYDFAGKIRNKNISKGGFQFASALYLNDTLSQIEKMAQSTFDEIVDKYVEMNIAHPFMEGNGRTMRIWLDLIFKSSMKLCVDWSKINKAEYLNAMVKSPADSSNLKSLIKNALTDEINSRETYMRGIDYSYYYEEAE